jgi:predicted secreted protein
MKHLAHVMAAFCLIALAIGGGPADAASGKSLKVGSSSQLKFGGNPSTGYRWRLDRGASTGLGLVKVQSLGYGGGSGKRDGHVVVGAPAPFAFRVTCVKPGTANLRFVYVGPTGKRSKQEGVSVRCN